MIAAGNEFRKSIGYPAAYVDQTGIVVSAMGRHGCFPAGACEVDTPTGTDPLDFVAPFTNIGPGRNSGPQISVIAPGVGVISTVPGGHGVMSGTSMAAPAVSGFAARLLTRNLAASPSNAVLHRRRDSQRVIDMIDMVYRSSQVAGIRSTGPRAAACRVEESSWLGSFSSTRPGRPPVEDLSRFEKLRPDSARSC